MASCSLSTPGLQLQGPLFINKSQFLGQTHIIPLPPRTVSSKYPRTITKIKPATIRSKFNLSELLGGRGLCNGEVGLQEELKKEIEIPPNTSINIAEEEKKSSNVEVDEGIPEDAFEKELFGLTGGFPGGEKGLQKFIEGNGLPDVIKLVKNENGSIPRSVKKMKLSEMKLKLKLKLPELSGFSGNDRDRDR